MAVVEIPLTMTALPRSIVNVNCLLELMTAPVDQRVPSMPSMALPGGFMLPDVAAQLDAVIEKQERAKAVPVCGAVAAGQPAGKSPTCPPALVPAVLPPEPAVVPPLPPLDPPEPPVAPPVEGVPA